jgi:hypothetical protein
LGPALQRALQALELARWDELPDAQLPWSSVRDAARRQGVSEADVVWDLCGQQEAAKPPKTANRRRKGKTPARRAPS